jgi:hypothetical protein
MTGFTKQQRAPHRRSLSHVRRTLQNPAPPTSYFGISFPGGTAGYLESATGVDMAIGGAWTIASMAYWGADADDFGVLLGVYDTNATRMVFFRDTNTFMKIDSGVVTRFANTSMAEGNWYLMLMTHAAGTTIPRLHYTADGVNMTHANTDGTQANLTTTSTNIALGAERTSAGGTQKGLTHELATTAIWSEDTNDAGCLALVDYANWVTKANQQFFPGSSMLSAGTMVDSSPNGNSETSRSGLSAGVQPIPTWFLNFPTGGGGGGGFSRLIVPSQRSSRMMVPVLRRRTY